MFAKAGRAVAVWRFPARGHGYVRLGAWGRCGDARCYLAHGVPSVLLLSLAADGPQRTQRPSLDQCVHLFRLAGGSVFC